MFDPFTVSENPEAFISNYPHNKVPVTFDHEGKTYHGTLEFVKGRGGLVWYLMINKYYIGQFHQVLDSPTPWDPSTWKNTDVKWIFSSQKGDLDHLGPYFEAVLIAWYE